LRSFASTNLKELLDELEKKLMEENQSGMANYSAANKAQKAKERAAKRVAKKGEKLKRKQKRKEEESDEEEDFDEEDMIEFNPNAKKEGEGEKENVENNDGGVLGGGDGATKARAGGYGRTAGRRARSGRA
jgi:hypothetical protein